MRKPDFCVCQLEIVLVAKMNFFTEKKNHDIFIDCENTLELGEAFLTSTHNLCFGATVRKNCITLYTSNTVLLVKRLIFDQ